MKAFVFLFCLTSSFAWSQELILTGQISNESGEPLAGATVVVDENHSDITNNQGAFNINLDGKSGGSSVRIIVRYLGYQTVDTSFILKSSKNTLAIVMKAAVFEQTKIEVVVTGYNAFKKNNWAILDFDFVGDKLLILYVKTRKPIIGLFEANGYLITEQKLKKNYNSIFKSCGGKYHIVGERECIELEIQNNTFSKLIKYPTKQFETLIKPCVYKRGQMAVLKSFAEHNKKASYHGFKPIIGKHHILDIYDEKAAISAQSYYREIIGTYFHTVETPDSAATNFGVRGDNLIARGEWSGDVNDLIVNKHMHRLVGQYLNTEVKEVKTVEIPRKNNLLIFDLIQQKAYNLDVDQFTAAELYIDPAMLSPDYYYYYDRDINQCIIVHDDNVVGTFDLEQEKSPFKPQAIPLNYKGSGIEGVQFKGSKLYYFSRNSASGFATRLHQMELDGL